MGIKAIEKVNVADKVYEQMKENIINGEWSPKDKIPSENELCRLFNVSRNTVRSAIQKLKAIGVLTTRQGQGTFVCDSIIDNFVDNFIPLVYLDKNEILEILEFRKIIEIESIGLTAIKASKQDIAKIRHNLDNMIANRGDYKKYSIADYQFHLSIARASQNKIYYRVMLRLKDVLYSHFEEMNEDLGPELSVENHKKIFKAIEIRDPKLAKYLLKETIELSINILKSK
jgi:GntR family transcriptional regulator, transcriptional repressor for pyruvate dehydrogenase complex